MNITLSSPGLHHFMGLYRYPALPETYLTAYWTMLIDRVCVTLPEGAVNVAVAVALPRFHVPVPSIVSLTVCG